VRRIGIIFAVCALMAADLRAESSWDDRQRSAWPEERERPATPLSEWLPSIWPGSQGDAPSTNASEPEPAATPPAAPSSRQQRSRAATTPAPEPEPEPQRTPEEEAAEAQWWEEIGNPAVAAFSRCLAVYVADETSLGSQASYPEFVTAAMHTQCSREFGAMAHVILEHHGEDNFAKIARRLIATEFVPTVKQVAEGGLPEEDPPEAIEPDNDGPTLEAAMRQSKEAMFGCLMNEADRLAATSAASPERVADLVIASCQTSAEAYFSKLEQLYPGATRGSAGEKSAAILDASYRPAIVQRIDAMRAENGRAENGHAENGRAESGRGDSVRADSDRDSR
jgi:hypothetical protein